MHARSGRLNGARKNRHQVRRRNDGRVHGAAGRGHPARTRGLGQRQRTRRADRSRFHGRHGGTLRDERSPLTMTEEIPADIEALVREGRKIEAIKQPRLRTGVDLKEAKDRIDALERRLGIERPSTTGKSLLFWTVLIVVAVAIFWTSSVFRHR